MLTPAHATTESGIVFLLDVDNTLLDNDRFADALSAHLRQTFGDVHCDRYWALFAGLRSELGYADYLGALQVFRVGLENHPELLRMSAFLLDFPFAQLLFPQSLEVIRHLGRIGLPVLLSDGDLVFQPRKVQRSGLNEAVAGRVMIQVRKQDVLAEVQRRYPARQYVMVDDKPQLLTAVKQQLGVSLTTVFVRQGHYALAAAVEAIDPPPDLCIEQIGELLGFDSAKFQVVTPV